MIDTLIVEDDRPTLNALATFVELEGFTVRTATTLAEARKVLEAATPKVILSDLNLPDGNGIELLEHLEEQSQTEVILITGEASLETAVTALREGAYDYLTKPVDEARLKTLLTNVARTTKLKSEITTLRRELRELGRFGDMVGTSDAMQGVYDLLERVAPTRATVFIVGESGTGKELAAATVHKLSHRTGAYVAINCGAIASNLIESELFGHEKGAFTGADRQHKGVFETANDGTLFLDEVTEMPLDLQIRLLRVLETGKVKRVGSVREQEVEVRIVAATNRDPEQAVADGKLREDLYYRLNVFPVQLPPLRERGGDVLLLAQHFLAMVNAEQDRVQTFTPEALDVLTRHSWPGNVRELKNAVRRASILADDKIASENLPPDLGGVSCIRRDRDDQPSGIQVGMSIAQAEKLLIEATLEETDGDKKLAADMLGISLKTLYNRLNSYRDQEDS